MCLSLYIQCLFYHELSKFDDEILLKGGENIRPRISNPELITQVANFITNYVLLY